MNGLVIICIFLTVIALLPAVGLSPFTSFFAKRVQSRIVQETYKFKRINIILSYYWAVLFVIAAFAVYLVPDTFGQYLIFMAIVLILGILGTVTGIKYLPQYITEHRKFTSCAEMFALLPYGVCLRYAKALAPNATIQFELTGKENIDGYLTLSETGCEFHYGTASTPTTKIKCDSQLWLRISNGEADPVRETVEGNLITEGNPSIMLHLQRFFHTGIGIAMPVKSTISEALYREYDRLTPVEIKKVVIFYSGSRSESFSKTLFMAKNLSEGIEAEGGSVEIVYLKDKHISNCTGCYTCWTKTPGKCAFEDDMPDLLQKYLDADLAVFASPLYIFSVNGIMKTFQDRLIPVLKPYMETTEEGKTYHPDRYGNYLPTHIMVISAGGFPNVEGNFDGMRELFKQFVIHSQRGTLRGELLLPAAEMIAFPIFTDRKIKVAECCRSVGRELIRSGCPSVDNLRQISNTNLSDDDFKHMANIFWANLDNKKAYMTTIDKL